MRKLDKYVITIAKSEVFSQEDGNSVEVPINRVKQFYHLEPDLPINALVEVLSKEVGKMVRKLEK